MKNKIIALITIAIIITTISAVSVSAESVWWNGSWEYSMKLTFDNSDQEENLTDFPVMVKLSTSNFDYTKCNPDGSDIRFVDGLTELSYEIELWNNTGDSIIWVNVIQIDGSSSTDYIQLYYGNENAVDNQDPEGVWNNGYAGVWHMGDYGTNDRLDSTENNNHGITHNFDGNEQVDGVIGHATLFSDDLIPLYNSGEYINVSYDESFNVSEYTLSCWYNKELSTLGSWTVFLGKGDERNGWGDISLATYRNTETMYAVRQNETETWQGIWSGYNGIVENGTWVYAVNRYDGSTQTLTYGNETSDLLWKYKNDTYGGTIQRDTPFRMGIIDTTDQYYSGIMDEIRLSTVARSNDWINAQYLSMNDEFITYGNENVSPFGWVLDVVVIFIFCLITMRVADYITDSLNKKMGGK